MGGMGSKAAMESRSAWVAQKRVGPAIRHLDQVRVVAPAFFEILALAIGISELYRASYGWVSPQNIQKYFGGAWPSHLSPSQPHCLPCATLPHCPICRLQREPQTLANLLSAHLFPVGCLPYMDVGELTENYYPGDIGFDPLGLKPTDPTEFAEMQTKELQNGRLAMLAAMGFILQETVNETPIIENLSG